MQLDEHDALTAHIANIAIDCNGTYRTPEHKLWPASPGLASGTTGGSGVAPDLKRATVRSADGPLCAPFASS